MTPTHAAQSPSDTVTSEDFDDLLNIWGTQWAKERGTTCSQIDYTAATIKGHGQSKRLCEDTHKLNIDGSELQHLESTKIDESEPQHIKSQEVKRTEKNHNSQMTFNFDIRYHKKTKTKLTRSLKLNAGIQLGFKVPPQLIGGTDLSLSAGAAVEQTKLKDHERQYTEEISGTHTETVNCKLYHVTSARLIIIEKTVETPFTQKQKLSGYIIIVCQDKILYDKDGKKHTKLAVPIGEVFKDLHSYQKDKKLNTDISDCLKCFDQEGDDIIFTLEGVITEIYQEINPKSIYLPIRDVTQPPDTLRQAYIHHHQRARAIERLFYKEPLPIKTDYIHLAMVNQNVYQDRLDKMRRLEVPKTLQQEVPDYESQQGYSALYALPGDKKTPYDILAKTSGREKTSQKILITGTAGIGKTTLSHRLMYLWATNSEREAQEHWGKEYRWVIRIALRDFYKENYLPEDARKNNYTHSDIANYVLMPTIINDLSDQIDSADGKLSPVNDAEKNYLAYTLEEALDVEDILLILDGYDEVVGRLIDDLSYLDHLLKSLLNYRHIVLTSRPYNIYDLDEPQPNGYGFKVDRRFEVTGFTPDNIKDYIHRFFSSLSSIDSPLSVIESKRHINASLEFLNRDIHIANACRIPINLELVCTLQEKGQIDASTNSMSRLYQRVAIALALRYLEKTLKEDKKELPDQNITLDYIRNELDESGTLLHCQIPFAVLEHLGFVSFVRHRIFVTLDETKKYIRDSYSKENSPETEVIKYGLTRQQQRFGFIKPIAALSSHSAGNPFYFNHLTFRDFFAARYLVYCLQKEINCEELISDYPHMWDKKISGKAATVKDFIQARKYDDSMEMILWLMAGQLAIIRDIPSIQYFLEDMVLGEPHDQVGYHEVLILVRCMDELRDVMDKLPAGLTDKLFRHIETWLTCSLQADHPVFMGEENATQLWERFRLSPWLLQQESIQTVLQELINQPQPAIFLSMIRFFRVTNSCSLQLFQKLIKGISQTEPKALPMIYEKLGEWVKGRQDLIVFLQGTLKTGEKIQVTALNTLGAIASARASARDEIALWQDFMQQPAMQGLIRPLTDGAQRGNPEVQIAALGALGAIAIASASASAIAIASSSARARDEIGLWQDFMQQPAMQGLIRPLTDGAQRGNPEVQIAALGALGAIAIAIASASARARDEIDLWQDFMQQPAMQGLIRPLTDGAQRGNPEVQIAALGALGAIASAIASASASARVRASAIARASSSARARDEIGLWQDFMQQPAMQGLIRPLTDGAQRGNPEVQIAALGALGASASAIAIASSSARARDEIGLWQDFMQQPAMQGLIRPLTDGAQRGNPEVQIAALGALGAIAIASASARARDEIDLWQDFMQQPAMQGLIRPLTDGAQRGNPEVQIAALGALGAIAIASASARAIASIIARDEIGLWQDFMQQPAMQGLIRPLTDGAQRGNPEVQIAALGALGAIASASASAIAIASASARAIAIARDEIGLWQDFMKQPAIWELMNPAIQQLARQFHLENNIYLALLLLPCLAIEMDQSSPPNRIADILLDPLIYSDWQKDCDFQTQLQKAVQTLEKSDLIPIATSSYNLLNRMLYYYEPIFNKDLSQQLASWPLDKAVANPFLLCKLLAGTPIDALWSYYASLFDRPERRQNILAVLVLKLFPSGKAIYTQHSDIGCQIHYYHNKMYQSLDLGSISIEQVQADFQAVYDILDLPSLPRPLSINEKEYVILKLPTTAQPHASNAGKLKQFINLYNMVYQSTLFKNPHSGMRKKLQDNEITTFAEVEQYADEHPTSRTAKIVRAMSSHHS